MKRSTCIGLLLAAALATGESRAKEASENGPQAAGRTYGQNYKDMVLVRCIARAYEGDAAASADASQTADELSASLYYDLASSNDGIPPLIERSLARDYHDPRLKRHARGQEFRLLKCLDLFHSKALEEQVKRYVPSPNRTYRKER